MAVMPGVCTLRKICRRPYQKPILGARMSPRLPALLAVCTLPVLLYPGFAAGAVGGAMCSQPTYSSAPAQPPQPEDHESQKMQLDEKIFVEADSANMTRD